MPRLVITPEMLAAAYDYLQTTKPFCDWNLPDSEDIQFVVYRSIKYHGDWTFINGRHRIRVSSRYNKSTANLMLTVAHEMVHVHEDHNNCSGRGDHSAAFNAWAQEVCEIHGWDPALF